MQTSKTESAPAERSVKEKQLIMIRILILAFVLFFNSITSSYLDTLLPDTMISFGVAHNKTEAGKPATWLYTAFLVGRFLSASLWGIFIDKYGRKSGLLIVLSLLIACTFLLGVSTSFYYAVVIRFITGLCNGLSIIGKTLSTEICPSDMKPLSISVTNTIWALGNTIGPITGSAFYNKWTSLPLLASSLAVCLIGCILFCLSFVFFEETLYKETNKSVDHTHIKQIDEEEDTVFKMETTNENIETELGKRQINANDELSLLNILNLPNVLKIIIIFSTNTFYASVVASLVPFWIASNYEDGGLGFTHHDISDIFMYLTLPQIVLQIILYPLIQKRRGDFWLITRGHFAHLPMFFFLPFAHLFGYQAFFAQKLWIIFWLFIRNLSSFMNFAVLQRFGNDLVSPKRRGRLNGIQITVSSIFQVLGSFLGTWLLSWSETNDLPYPFNYHFVFLLMCFITVGAIINIYNLTFVDKEKTQLLSENNIKNTN